MSKKYTERHLMGQANMASINNIQIIMPSHGKLSEIQGAVMGEMIPANLQMRSDLNL
jgi:hypothetical protein